MTIWCGPDPDGKIEAALDASRKSTAQSHLHQQAYQCACQCGDWQSAEDERLRAMTWMEAALDHFASACRLMLEMSRRG